VNGKIVVSIVEIATISSSVFSAVGLFITIQNNYAIYVVSKQTNHMKDELVDEVRKASYARGKKDRT
jgi:hypothetical protein